MVCLSPRARKSVAPRERESLASASAWRGTGPRGEPDMETERVRTDRLGLLLDQFDCAREMAQVRLTGLSDEEYLWEPAPGSWSIRRRGEAATPRAFGPGDWVLD